MISSVGSPAPTAAWAAAIEVALAPLCDSDDHQRPVVRVGQFRDEVLWIVNQHATAPGAHEARPRGLQRVERRTGSDQRDAVERTGCPVGKECASGRQAAVEGERLLADEAGNRHGGGQPLMPPSVIPLR